jgi:hypothetical protein
MMKSAAMGTIALGILLVVLSAAWTTIFPSSARWTPDKESHWQKVKGRMHTLSFVVSDPKQADVRSRQNATSAKAEFDKLKLEDDELKADFSSAYDTPRTTSTVLKWLGISIAGIGLIGYYAVNQSR